MMKSPFLRLSKALIWLLLAIALVACAPTLNAAPNQPQQQGNLVGERTLNTPTTTLATYMAAGQQWNLVSYRDLDGENCLAVDQGVQQGIPACAIPVDAHQPVNAALVSKPNDVIILYGRVDETVQHLYAISAGKRQSDQPIYRDPSSGERYFALLIVGKSVTDVNTITTNGKRFSLKPQLDEFYTPLPS